MSAESQSRRAFLAAAGTGLGAAWLAASPEDIRAALVRETVPQLRALTPGQAADIEAISAQILPTDELPGAREARVVNFVDRSLDSWARNQKDQVLNGLAAFNDIVGRRYAGTQRFGQLGAEQQLEFLRANEQHPFFQQMIALTLIGTFAHPGWGGNYDKSGWRILGFEDRFLWQPPFGWYDARANGGPN
jgi:gluconate 2-dehydrogenase gamma chain